MACGLSQAELARASGACSAAYVSRVEAADRVPSLQVIEALAMPLGVTTSWLARGDGSDDGGQQRRALSAKVAALKRIRSEYDRSLDDLLRALGP